MTALVTSQAITIVPGTPVTAGPFTLDPLTDNITVSFVTSSLQAWVGITVSVDLIISVDGVDYHCTGGTTGGVKAGALFTYSMSYGPTTGFFGGTSVQQRLGQTALSSYTARVVLNANGGTANTSMSLNATASVAPSIPFHSSVAFDAATPARQVGGSGTITFSHVTGSGSNLAAFAAHIDYSGPSTSDAITWGGVSMTQQWSENNLPAGSGYFNAGYSLANNQVASGSTTVVDTVTGYAGTVMFTGAVTFTGVDQSTPCGTPVTGNSAGAGTTASVTVSGVGSSDIVVDSAFAATTTLTAGTNQVSRLNDSQSGGMWAVSTKLGSFGSGVMSWTIDNNAAWHNGAIAFKAAAGTAQVPYRNPYIPLLAQ